MHQTEGANRRVAAAARESGKEAVPEVEAENASEAKEGDPEPEMTAEEKTEAEAEKRVEAFDALTDHWMEGEAKTTPTMKDVAKFVADFKQVPKDRQDECLHRALNLIPDANVMLLAGILFDKEIDKDSAELVFNDILNRDEDVKKPILQEVFKDKTHPCWADAAWILDVTDDLPKAKQ